MKTNKPTKFYINRAKQTAEDADKLLQAVKRCLNESELFPIYLPDLQTLVDNLMYLNVMHNAVHNEFYSSLKRKKKKGRK